MNVTIVYKTYGKDVPFLRYSLLSLQKYVTGIHAMILYFHDICWPELQACMDPLLPLFSFPVTMVPVHYNFHGYIKQMVVKSMCFQDVQTEYVLFMDSDTMFTCPYHPSMQLDDTTGKIRWHMLEKRTDNQQEDCWKVWEPAVQGMTKAPMTVYYMNNGFPFLLKTNTLKRAADHFQQLHQKSYEEYVQQKIDASHIPVEADTREYFLRLATVFEEFEFFGFYAEHFEPESYIFCPSTGRPSKRVKQFWSHGGMSPAIVQELQSLL